MPFRKNMHIVLLLFITTIIPKVIHITWLNVTKLQEAESTNANTDKTIH